MFYYALILVFLACCIVVVEFFIPSAGVLGILAGSLAIAALWFGFSESMANGTIILILEVIAVPILFYSWLKVWPHTPLGKQILQGDLEDVCPLANVTKKLQVWKDKWELQKAKCFPVGKL